MLGALFNVPANLGRSALSRTSWGRALPARSARSASSGSASRWSPT